MTDMIAVPGCDREAISWSLSLFVRNLELGRMLHEYHLSKTSLIVMEDKLNHVRRNVNPALWAETFADDEDFYEAGYQPGNEVELFASDEAGQLAKRRLAVLEKYELAEARVPREDYSLTGPHQDLLTFGQTVKKTDVLPASPESDGYWVSVSPEPSPGMKPAEGHDLKNVALGRSVGRFKTTPSSSPSPAPPEDSPTADDRAEALQLQNSLLLAASDLTVVDECVRKLVKQEEPSLVRSGTQPPGDTHYWPIFANKLSVKRDAPDRMPDAPISGDGDADGADGAN